MFILHVNHKNPYLILSDSIESNHHMMTSNKRYNSLSALLAGIRKKNYKRKHHDYDQKLH